MKGLLILNAIVGFLASVIGITVFFTGKQSFADFFGSKDPTNIEAPIVDPKTTEPEPPPAIPPEGVAGGELDSIGITALKCLAIVYLWCFVLGIGGPAYLIYLILLHLFEIDIWPYLSPIWDWVWLEATLGWFWYRASTWGIVLGVGILGVGGLIANQAEKK